MAQEQNTRLLLTGIGLLILGLTAIAMAFLPEEILASGAPSSNQAAQIPTSDPGHTKEPQPAVDPTDEPAPTVTPTAIPRPTQTPAPTAMPSPTNTPTPTDTPSPTPTTRPTDTPRPVPTCTPTPPACPPPSLTGLNVMGCNITLSWEYGCPLATDEWFAVRVGIGEPHSVVWVKDLTYTYTSHTPGEYSVEIAICRGDPLQHRCSPVDGSELAVSERSVFGFGGCGGDDGGDGDPPARP